MVEGAAESRIMRAPKKNARVRQSRGRDVETHRERSCCIRPRAAGEGDHAKRGGGGL